MLQKLVKEDKAEIQYTQNGFIEHKNMDSSQKFKKNLDVLLANDYRNKISDNVRRSIKKKLDFYRYKLTLFYTLWYNKKCTIKISPY